MSARLTRRSLPLPPRSSRMDQDVREAQKPGIVTVLGCDHGTARATSLRRTLSADMSSREWLANNGFHPLKKTASSVSIEDSSSSDDEDDTLRKDVEGCGGQVYIWKSMKRVDTEESEKGGATWSSLLFQKVEDSKSLPPPYIHPMVKRSKSCLSTKSLEVCTESLGSETGSDGFSSYPASEVGDVEAEDGNEPRATTFDNEEFYVPKCNHATADRKMRPQSFPPPIQSLSQRNGGGTFSMHSRRDNGRLVLEAVSVSTERNFESRREEGRLVLTFMNGNESYREYDDDMDEEEDDLVMEMDEYICVEEDEEEVETEENDEEGVYTEFAVERAQEQSIGGPMNVHKLAKMLNKPITMVNRNPGWQGKYVEAFNYGEEEQENPIHLEQSLSLKSPVAWMLSTPNSVPPTAMAPTSLNAYEYFWRNKTPNNTSIASLSQPLSTMKGYGLNISVYAKNPPSEEAFKNRPITRRDGYPVPLLQSCNSPSRTNLLWEPKCIATS